MNVLGVIKIAAVVGLSALKVVSAVVKVNEMKKQGNIVQFQIFAVSLQKLT